MTADPRTAPRGCRPHPVVWRTTYTARTATVRTHAFPSTTVARIVGHDFDRQGNRRPIVSPFPAIAPEALCRFCGVTAEAAGASSIAPGDVRIAQEAPR